LERLLARLQAATDAQAPRVARECLRDTIGFLTRYFGVMRAGTAQRLGQPQMKVDGTRQAEKVIGSTLGPMLKTADPMAMALRSVFFREQLSGEFLPFPHTRLLLRDGWLASGSQTLTEWLNNSCEPESEESCRAEVEALLPILSKWLAAAGPFFLECRYEQRSFMATGMRGLEGGQRVPLKRVELLTRFRDLQTGLPLRTRDMEPPPAAVPDAAPLAQLVQDLLEAAQQPVAAPAYAPLPLETTSGAPPQASPRQQLVQPAKGPDEFDWLLTAAPLAAACVLGYLLMLAL
jgi:hypothetical protein